MLPDRARTNLRAGVSGRGGALETRDGEPVDDDPLACGNDPDGERPRAGTRERNEPHNARRPPPIGGEVDALQKPSVPAELDDAAARAADRHEREVAGRKPR